MLTKLVGRQPAEIAFRLEVGLAREDGAASQLIHAIVLLFGPASTWSWKRSPP